MQALTYLSGFAKMACWIVKIETYKIKEVFIVKPKRETIYKITARHFAKKAAAAKMAENADLYEEMMSYVRLYQNLDSIALAHKENGDIFKEVSYIGEH